MIPIALAVAVAVVVAEVATSGGGSSTARAAPDLPEEVLVGPAVTLDSLRGKPVVVNFWASWCSPCKREAPELKRLSRELPGGARLVGVDWADSEAGARTFIKKNRWTFPNLRDANATVGDRYRLTGLPTTYVIDSRGRIKATLRGPQQAESVLHALDSTR